MKLFFLFCLIPITLFAMDDFEKDLAALKAKYKDTYKKEENVKWQEVVEDEAKPSFSERFHEKFRHLDLNVFFNYYFFNSTFNPDGQIAGQLSSAGPDLDALLKLWKAFDLYIYGNYGFTGEASFVETPTVYSVPNNYLLGVGAYFSNKFPTVRPYVSFELQGQSFVGVNNDLDYSTINVLTQLQAEQVTAFNMTFGTDIPFRIDDKDGLVRAYLTPSILARAELMDATYSQYVTQFQYGIKLKYFFYKSYALDLGWRGGFYQGETSQDYNSFFLNVGFRF